MLSTTVYPRGETGFGRQIGVGFGGRPGSASDGEIRMLHRAIQTTLFCGCVLVLPVWARHASAAQVPYRSLVTARDPVTYLMLDETSGTTANDTSTTPGHTSRPGTFSTRVTLNHPRLSPHPATPIP